MTHETTINCRREKSLFKKIEKEDEDEDEEDVFFAVIKLLFIKDFSRVKITFLFIFFNIKQLFGLSLLATLLYKVAYKINN